MSFHLRTFGYNSEEKNSALARATVYVCMWFASLLVSAWGFSGDTSFLPHPKDAHA